MDIKDLNKSQLILLAVLLSFITSIATGITTVTLMQQAPISFTAPVNRIIRQTVEKIQQVEGKTTVQTVIVKEEDLVVDAIAKNREAVFAISKDITNEEGSIVEIGAGRGFAVTDSGLIAVDDSLAFDKGAYYIKNDSGKFKADFVKTEKEGFSILKAGDPVDGKSKLAFTVPDWGDVEKMKIGQKILVVGSSISSFIFEGDKNIKMNVTKSNGGAIVLDLNGNALGIVLSGEDAPFAPISAITNALLVSESEGESTSVAAPILAPGVTPGTGALQ